QDRKALARADQDRYLNRVAQAGRDWRGGRFDAVRKSLAECKPELRHWEWHYLSRCLQVEPRVLRGHGAAVWAVTYSRDGQRLASAGLDNLVHIWNPDSGELLLTLKGHTGPVWSVTFSTDGTRIATGSDDATVRLWDATTGKELQSFE